MLSSMHSDFASSHADYRLAASAYERRAPRVREPRVRQPRPILLVRVRAFLHPVMPSAVAVPPATVPEV